MVHADRRLIFTVTAHRIQQSKKSTVTAPNSNIQAQTREMVMTDGVTGSASKPAVPQMSLPIDHSVKTLKHK